MNDSRLRLGPIRLSPTLHLTNAGYDDNVFGASEGAAKIGDWSATVSGGLEAILPVGSKIYLRGEIFPSYSWYKERDERRTFGGRYRGSFFAFFNRASLEVDGYSTRGLAFLSSESETQAVRVINDAQARLELNLTGKLSAFVGGEFQQVSTDSPPAEDPDQPPIDANTLDRNDGAARGGLRYRISDAWNVSMGVEGTRTDFRTVPQERNNNSVAYLVGVFYNRPRFFVNVWGGYREGRPGSGSSFLEYSTPTGSYFISYFLRRNVELSFQGARRVVYSLSGTDPFFFETRNGAELRVQVRPRISVSGFGDLGTNDYPFKIIVDGQEIEHTDKTSSYGGGFSLRFYRKLVLSARASRSTYDSKVPGRDRSVVRFTTNLTF